MPGAPVQVLGARHVGQDLFTSGGGAAATQRRPRPAASRSPAPRPREAFPIGCRRGFSGGGRQAEPHVPPRPISAGHARGLPPSLLALPRWAGRGLRTYDAAVRAPRAARREGHVPVGAVRLWRARLVRAVRGRRGGAGLLTVQSASSSAVPAPPLARAHGLCGGAGFGCRGSGLSAW